MAHTSNPFPDLRELKHFTDETHARALELPINGKTYRFDAGKISFRAGLLITRMRVAQALYQAALDAGEDPDPEVVTLDDDEYRHVLEQLVTPERRDEFIADGLTVDEVEHVRKTVLLWLMWGEEAAADYWVGKLSDGGKDGPDPKVPASASTKTAGSSTRKSSTGTNRRRSTGSTSSKPGDSSRPDSTPTTPSTSRRRKPSTDTPGGGSR
ncbi:DUF7426 family protein [Labedaea rhizosphaerae]|uniref:DUF7426 domain-containing protein n=1 Tax=Labedaea rhizosphaerae TaxID=598644 RepID=A0A4R6RU87_LABRH|nr:hypothetical protein [Labedaea rhizosphaerae]TDP90519.1 hypothetical protein EV186_11059 [Labedaea rhizosphaerae]